MIPDSVKKFNHSNGSSTKETGQLNILIVDDEKYICLLMTELLDQNSHHCDSAANGKEALDLIAKKNYDIVITDIKMPLMDGFDLLRSVKQSHPHIAIVVMTAFGQEYSVREALALGAEEYLPKPFHAEEVINVVERAYWRSQAKRGISESIS